MLASKHRIFFFYSIMNSNHLYPCSFVTPQPCSRPAVQGLLKPQEKAAWRLLWMPWTSFPSGDQLSSFTVTSHEINLAFVPLVGLDSAVFLPYACVTDPTDVLNCDFSFGDCPTHPPAGAMRGTAVMADVPKCTKEGPISPFSAGSRGLCSYYS